MIVDYIGAYEYLGANIVLHLHFHAFSYADVPSMALLFVFDRRERPYADLTFLLVRGIEHVVIHLQQFII